MSNTITRGAHRRVAIIVAALALIVLSFLFLPSVPAADAVTLQPLTVAELTAYSDVVVVARVAATSSRHLPGGTGASGLGSVETLVQLEVLDALKGSSPDERLLVLPGGTAAGVSMTVDYVPAFAEGETCVLFIDEQGRIVGGPQGKLVVLGAQVPALGMSLARLQNWVETGDVGDPEQSGVGHELFVKRDLYATSEWPLIENISPGSGSAGTNTRVTIKGSGFGEKQGTGGVNFWYGNLGHATISAPVVSWSNTSIVCVVPTAIIDGYSGSAGSGPVTVVTSAGLTSNNYDFHVTFSYSGSRWGTAGFTYRVNANTSDTPDEKAMIDAAATTWNSASNFRFNPGGSCTTTSKAADGHNDIFFSTSSLPAGVLAMATVWSDAANLSVILEADITFNDSASMPLWGDGNSGTLDVQAVALHELGHTLGLLDVYGPNDRGKVMYGIESDFSVSPRQLSDDDMAGAAYIYGGGSGGGGGDDSGGGGEDDSGSDSHLFSDLSPENPYFAAITDLAGQGVITGFSDGTFRPDDSVTRQQFAKMIVRTLGLEVTGDEVSSFTDVLAQTGADPLYPSKYVAVCAAAGITTGKTESTFAPKESITRQQLITMIARAAHLADAAASYRPDFMAGQFSLPEHYENAVNAGYVGLLDGLIGVGPGYDFKKPSTRAECAQLLSVMRQEQPKEGQRVVFADDFSGREAGWPEFQWPDWRWLIDSNTGLYAASIDTASTLVLSCLPEERGACSVEVDAHCTSASDEVTYGIAFRVSSDLDSMYGFTVSSKGSWEVWRRTKGTWGAKESIAGKTTGLVNKGKAWNNLRVTMDGGSLELFVNGNKVFVFTKTLGTSGLVGLLAGSPADPRGQEVVIFDNFKIWTVR